MADEQKDYRRPFRAMMVVIVITMMGWIVPFGYANYQLDRCSESLHVRLDDINAKIAGARRALEQR
jgi:hypothetical protein